MPGVFYIVQGECGEDVSHPNCFNVPTKGKVTLDLVKRHFPLRAEGTFHFRFRAAGKGGAFSWVDVGPGAELPRGQLFMKVLRTDTMKCVTDPPRAFTTFASPGFGSATGSSVSAVPASRTSSASPRSRVQPAAATKRPQEQAKPKLKPTPTVAPAAVPAAAPADDGLDFFGSSSPPASAAASPSIGFSGDMLGGAAGASPRKKLAKVDEYGGDPDPFKIAKMKKITVVKCSSCAKHYVPSFLNASLVSTFKCAGCGTQVNLGGGAVDLMGGSSDVAEYTDLHPLGCPLIVTASFGEMTKAVQVAYLTRLQKAKKEEEAQLEAHRQRIADADAANDAQVDVEKQLLPRLKEWAFDKGGELRDIRMLLAQFHTLANWPGSLWEPVHGADLLTDAKMVKKKSRMILQKFHPDKIEPDAPTHERVVCAYCSEKVRQAFRKFQKEEKAKKRAAR